MSFKNFHLVTRAWFQKNIGEPTEAQAQAWPAILAGEHTLIAAPTGSGKTLAAFYAVIDRMVQQALRGELAAATQVVYVSPLKALSNDIHRNLEIPLTGIQNELSLQVYDEVHLKVAVRTGDTTPSERQQMLKKPPHILVTTPESLYLLLTSKGGRQMLSQVNTLILDEIHALLGDKRGAHLALSVERLEALILQNPKDLKNKKKKKLQRIGLSATQKPIERVAKFLVGKAHIHAGVPSCHIVNAGHQRKLEVSVEVPSSPLTAVMSNEVWEEIYRRLVELIEQHQTTLIFVNTRRLAERLARSLSQYLSEDLVSSHHGSMSKEHRHRAEQKLKAGHLRVLVATASMELGIDIGSVNLVVQISSPKSIAAFIQRVGRSGHYVGGTPKGILFPLTRDDLVESIALVESIRHGELDEIIIPEKPLDILAQQIVAEVAGQDWEIENLYQCFSNAYPYQNLKKEEFLEIVEILSQGFSTRRGRRGAYLHLDAINQVVKARQGARLTALTCGGAIPDMFDYTVVMDPEDVVVGSLNEDFALESLPGDIFSLGNHSWQMLRLDGLKVRVRDAQGLPPTVPFWLGEGPGRTRELSESVSRLRKKIFERLNSFLNSDQCEDISLNEKQLQEIAQSLNHEMKIMPSAVQQLVEYLYYGSQALQAMPTQECIVMERFFDEVGDMHLVIHAPFGSRVNKAWGLALRKKFCKTFNFELQAAANEDSIVISLGSVHSFVLEDVFHYLKIQTLKETLTQALLDTPMFEVRWRWNASRSLAIRRYQGGKRTPPQFQRMQAEDLVALVFPDQLACFENIQGQREIPEHPLVTQTLKDCLNEAMDYEGFEKIVSQIEKKQMKLIAKDLREPSPFAQEIINARPYAFLDDAPLEERRTNAIRNRRWLDTSEFSEFSHLEASAIEQVKNEAWPQIEGPEQLHDALMWMGFLLREELGQGYSAELYEGWMCSLIEAGRATKMFLSLASVDGEVFETALMKFLTKTAKEFKKFHQPGLAAALEPQARKWKKSLHRQDLEENTLAEKEFWIAAELSPQLKLLYPDARFEPEVQLPDWVKVKEFSAESALEEILRGRLEALGPVTLPQLLKDFCLEKAQVQSALVTLENQGFVFRGQYSIQQGEEEWCERRLLQRIHKYSIESHRQSIQPVSLQDFMCFLFEYHGLSGETYASGPDRLKRILETLEGMPASAIAWEEAILPARMKRYDPQWLDMLCTQGQLIWGRYSFHRASEGKSRSGPIKSTPISLILRKNQDLWRELYPFPSEEVKLSSAAQQVYEDLKQYGASFFTDILDRNGLLPSQVEDALAELVASAKINCDTFHGLRALLKPAHRYSRRAQSYRLEEAGRWAILAHSPKREAQDLSEEMIFRLIKIYLKRWGVLFRQVIEREYSAPPWRVLVRALRRMELRGEIRGGRFVSGVSGEQFAWAETVTQLRKVSQKEKKGDLIAISAADPLNLLGILMPNNKIVRLSANRILFEDGLPVALLESKEIKYLKQVNGEKKYQLHSALVKNRLIR
ncbi:MAG: DEAD/DEAH box helicase [Deltaproteobacteria bacterium]|nr:DEAD/DEAH box helicase [Deltaproteobacteria bacterium]